jgi:signal transduction histidine kinase/CheY-like chemotaxis protein
MRSLLVVAAALQVAAVAYCALLLRRHRNAAAPWLYLLGALLSMLVWRLVMTTGATPGLVFNTSIAIWGSVCAVLAMFFFGREMARRERAEEERDRLLTSERAARAAAERASRINDDFMATLSHELRSPLAAMLGWCAIARKEDLSPGVARAVETIERNARIQARLVDDLLDATRMQAGALHLELAPVALDGPVRAAIEGVRPTAEAKRLTLRYECEEPPVIVVGDASRLQQVASNLLVNAVKFTPDGRTIEVRVASTAGHAELTVVDDGIGIDEAFMPHLFERFRQGDSGAARRHGGLGLGLSIVSNLVYLHGGDVEAVSDGPGRGASFRVRLPAYEGAVAPPGAYPEAAMLAGAELAVEGVRVVVVDDDADVRRAVSGLLEGAGALVLALESGASLESALIHFRPDVLVLDIGMPGEDGFTLIGRIRRLPKAAGGATPAISLTAHVRDEDRRHALDLGFQAHLAKPVDVITLLATIRRLVQTAGGLVVR